MIIKLIKTYTNSNLHNINMTNTEFDITNIIVEKLNKELPSLNLK